MRGVDATDETAELAAALNGDWAIVVVVLMEGEVSWMASSERSSESLELDLARNASADADADRLLSCPRVLWL